MTIEESAMQQPPQSPTRLRFGIFEADLRAGELTKQGRRISLQDQPFRMLVMLLEKPGEVVTREELRARLWPQTIVDFDHGLNKAISKVRDALGDSAESPRFIETVARRGYRFLAVVSAVSDAPPALPTSQPTEPAPRDPSPVAESTPVSRHLTWTWRLAGLAIVVLALAAVSAWMRYESQPPTTTIRSLAVLPLENLSNDASQEYFADGMTEELITSLGQIRSLRVISRTSVMTYKRARKPLADVARELNVQAVVEGSVFRSGDRVRITAQLIKVPADEPIWAQTYDGDLRDTLALQSKVAQAIAERVQATLSRQEQDALAKSKAVNPQAYEAYLKGRFFWQKRTAEGLKKSIEYFNRAIEIEASYAEAWSGLADAYALSGDWEYGVLAPREAFAKAKDAATRALALDEGLGAAHTSLAFALDLYGWDWDTAGQEYRRAIELNPGYATTHHWYAFHLLVLHHDREGILELRKAESLDPLSLIISADIADALCIAHLFDESVQQSRKTLEMDPNFALAHYELGQALEQKHQHDEAIAEFQKAIELAGHSGAVDSNLAYAYAVSGRKEVARKIVAELQARYEGNPSADANIALVYVGLGDLTQAMSWLNKACDARFNPSILLRPAFDPLRADVRFKELRGRVGLSS